jgi:hypothetical protein
VIVQSVLLVSSAISTSVSPELITELDRRVRADLQNIDDRFFFWVAASAIVVAIGCLMEGPEIFHELWPITFPYFGGRWVKKLALIGWLVVVLGGAAEGVFEIYDHDASGMLQTFDELLLGDAQRNADNAKLAASAASEAARTAREQSDAATISSAGAQKLANGARKEADSFDQRIVSATNTATTAEQHLAEALKEATQAEAELERIRTPRSISNTSDLIAGLGSFRGTTYTFTGVYSDQESLDLLRQIDSALTAAGWTRVKPPDNNPIILTVAPGFTVAPSTQSGVLVQAESANPAATMAIPPPLLPSYLRAGIALKMGLANGIVPPQQELRGPLGVSAGSHTDVFITVGKKP